ncbi:ABC-2 transporter permease [Paenibacillus thiaminolyticus]|uniref:ABC-2 transporter permease n=1 Tax=Paenibacillus thiaminolyticus TaxID=49283 RepID=UPI00232AD107|nr:ABC-2 transporter permease [Paenibacillus thiaminolyticus]WCF10984.1 ABC-2 transporter permease [Paenibacillus thiaminolyticus]WII35009.1 ABC-2 transporter permease [Paenibacillus thiaminolyticus]
MLNLLRKDFIALKSSLGVLIICLAVFSIAFIPKHDMSLFTVGFTVAIVALNMSTLIDIRNHNHNFLVTLPIKRKHIVLAKYITSSIATLCGVLASYVIHSLVTQAFPQLNKPDHSILGLFVLAGMMLVFISIYLPLFYTFSKKGAEIINVVSIIVLFALMNPLVMLMSMMNDDSFISSQILFLISIGILLLLIASYYLTVHLFTRKDL